jgi:hypothetical protein
MSGTLTAPVSSSFAAHSKMMARLREATTKALRRYGRHLALYGGNSKRSISDYFALRGLRNEASEQVANRLVDGGYLKTTAYDLARALLDLDDSIHPVIVHITNDPVARYDFRDEKGRAIEAFQNDDCCHTTGRTVSQFP